MPFRALTDPYRPHGPVAVGLGALRDRGVGQIGVEPEQRVEEQLRADDVRFDTERPGTSVSVLPPVIMAWQRPAALGGFVAPSPLLLRRAVVVPPHAASQPAAPMPSVAAAPISISRRRVSCRLGSCLDPSCCSFPSGMAPTTEPRRTLCVVEDV